MPAPRVVVGRHRVHARVVGDTRPGEPALLQAVTDGLAEALDEAPVGDGYWILRRVDASSRLGAAWSSTQMSRALARDIAGAVSDVQARGIDPERALWFPDRTAFLARFLQDLAEGRTSGRWEYAGLGDVLRGPGATLAALARDEPAEVAEALAALSVGVLELLAGQVADQESVLAHLAPRSATGEVTPVVATLSRLLAAGRHVGPLLLAVRAAADHGLPLAAVRAPAVAAAGLAALTSRHPGVTRALRDADWAALAPLGEEFLGVVAWSAPERAALADALAAPAPPGATVAEVAHTPFGGAFLLAPLLDGLADWRALPGPDADQLRLLVLTAALGRGTSLAPLADPVLRRLYGVAGNDDPLGALAGTPLPPGLEVAPVSDPVRLAGAAGPTADLVAGAAAALLAALGRQLPGMAAASPAYLWTNVLDLDATVTWGEGEHLVELGHPPLAVLLAIAGLTSGSFRVRGHEEVRWTLTTAR